MYKELELYRILSRIYLAFNCELLENGNYGILTCADNYFRQKYLQTEYLIKQQAIKYGINIEASMMLSNYDGQITYVPQIHFMDLNNSINIDRQSINYIKDKIIRICPNILLDSESDVSISFGLLGRVIFNNHFIITNGKESNGNIAFDYDVFYDIHIDGLIHRFVHELLHYFGLSEDVVIQYDVPISSMLKPFLIDISQELYGKLRTGYYDFIVRNRNLYNNISVDIKQVLNSLVNSKLVREKYNFDFMNIQPTDMYIPNLETLESIHTIQNFI